MGVSGIKERRGPVADQIIRVGFHIHGRPASFQPLQRIIGVGPIFGRHNMIQDREKIPHRVVGRAEGRNRRVSSNKQGRLDEMQ